MGSRRRHVERLGRKRGVFGSFNKAKVTDESLTNDVADSRIRGSA
ncbi:hypothetical protein CCACVL1_06140, partial [Corchorus capsularis]